MKSLKFSCPDDLRAWIDAKAERESRSVSQVIRLALYRDQLRESASTGGKAPAEAGIQSRPKVDAA